MKWLRCFLWLKRYVTDWFISIWWWRRQCDDIIVADCKMYLIDFGRSIEECFGKRRVTTTSSEWQTPRCISQYQCQCHSPWQNEGDPSLAPRCKWQNVERNFGECNDGCSVFTLFMILCAIYLSSKWSDNDDAHCTPPTIVHHSFAFLFIAPCVLSYSVDHRTGGGAKRCNY